MKNSIRPVKIHLKHYIRRRDGAHGVVATAKFAGSPVVAHAVCNPNDVYDEARGDELATARLELSVARRRVALRKHDIESLSYALSELTNYYNNAVDALDKAIEAEEAASNHLDEVENSFR